MLTQRQRKEIVGNGMHVRVIGAIIFYLLALAKIKKRPEAEPVPVLGHVPNPSLGSSSSTAAAEAAVSFDDLSDLDEESQIIFDGGFVAADSQMHSQAW